MERQSLLQFLNVRRLDVGGDDDGRMSRNGLRRRFRIPGRVLRFGVDGATLGRSYLWSEHNRNQIKLSNNSSIKK